MFLSGISTYIILSKSSECTHLNLGSRNIKMCVCGNPHF